MKHGYLVVVASLLLATGLMSGCGSITGGSPPNIYAGAVFISDRETAGTYELFINDNTTNVISKMSDTLTPGGNVQSFKMNPNIGFIAYLADQELDTVNELYYIKESVGDVVKLNANLVVGENVLSYEWSPNGLLMAYIVQNVSGINELYVSDANNNIKVSPTGITGSGVSDFKWSPNSNYVAFKSQQIVAGKTELYTVKADGSVVAVQVSDSTIGVGPVEYEWAIDSSLLAYSSDQDTAGVIDLYTTSVDALSSTKVTDVTTGSVQTFSWPHLSSSTLSYSANPLATDDINLYITSSADNSNVVQVSNVTAGGGVTNDFLWAPNDASLAYVADQDNVGVYELYTTLLDGVIKGTKVSTAMVTGGDVDITDGFVWSLFSNQLIYRADQETDGVFELFASTTDAVTSTQGVKLSGDSTAAAVPVGEQFLLSPFGNVLSFTAEETAGQSELFVTTLVDNSGIVKLSGATMVANGDVYQHDWSSDGTKVFYVADQDTDGTNDVYTTITSDLTNTNLSSSPTATGILQGAFVDSFGVSETLFPL